MLKFQASALRLLAQEGYDPEMGARLLRRTPADAGGGQAVWLSRPGDLVAGSQRLLKVGVKGNGNLKFEMA